MSDIAELQDGYVRLSLDEIAAHAIGSSSRLSAGVRSAMQTLSRELHIQRQHATSLENARSYFGRTHLKLNFGCGSEYKGGWINIDLWPDTDLQLDLREDLPFENGSASVIYSEHFLEALEYPSEVTHLLQESLRILEPGGKFSVGVPDTEETLVQYALGKLPVLMQRWSRDESLAWVAPVTWETPMHLVNFVLRQGREIKYSFDSQTLIRVLEQAGFVGVRKRDFQSGLDSEHRRDGTLYVDAFKPMVSEPVAGGA